MHSLQNHLVIAGGSGFLGRALAHFWAQHHGDVVILTRTPRLDREENGRAISFVPWDARRVGAWSKYLHGARALVNLTGRSVNCRYNVRHKREILLSRTLSTRALGQALAQIQNPPSVWLNSSSATIYRDARDRAMDEANGDIGQGFSVGVCQAWEKEFFGAQLGDNESRVRRVALRMAMVMADDAHSAFSVFARLSKLGLGGPHGGGGQFMSWIHVTDLCRAVEFLIEHEEVSGVVNLAAPNPLPETEFLKAIRAELRVPFGLPTPRPLLEVGAFFMGTETELLLKSRRVVPTRLLDAGFAFNFSTWNEAARDLAHSGS
jgi:uncharacterized protein (TIGR01777 family)